ncbi:MAG: hypothetical protein RRY34_00110 [Victivallaceae bacterium]
MKLQWQKFTLIELIAVICILVLTLSIAVVLFRGDSARPQLERAALDFESFCARGRFQAMETGCDKVAALDLNSDTFFLVEAELFGNDDAAYQLTLDFKPPVIRYPLPEKCELQSDLVNANDLLSFGEYALIPVFRFFPDGGAAGSREFKLGRGEWILKLKIAPLTGSLAAEIGRLGEVE